MDSCSFPDPYELADHEAAVDLSSDFEDAFDDLSLSHGHFPSAHVSSNGLSRIDLDDKT